jgi:hypothetical protein
LVQPNGYIYSFVKVSACLSIMKNIQKSWASYMFLLLYSASHQERIIY